MNRPRPLSDSVGCHIFPGIISGSGTPLMFGHSGSDVQHFENFVFALHLHGIFAAVKKIFTVLAICDIM